MCGSWSPSWLCFRIGIADATALAELAIFSPSGEGERPAGEAMEVGRMKSSRFMGSMAVVVAVGGVCWWTASSDVLRSCAMPLGAGADEGALVGGFLRRLIVNCQFGRPVRK